jgi:hypothetical protein
MHHAMRMARLAIACTEDGASTWGAYQHYGNPYFQLFNPVDNKRDEEGERGKKKSAPRKKAAPSSKKAAGRKAGKTSAKAGRKSSRR